MGNNILKIENLSVTFNKNFVFKNINLTLREGELIIIVGQSGIGKTSLLRAIKGLIPFTGTIKTQSLDQISYITQSPDLWTNLTVLENILLVRKLLFQENKFQALKTANLYLGLLEVDHLKNKYPITLSGGEKQRVNFARGLSADKPIILLDEITSNIDNSRREIVLNIIKKLLNNGKSVIFTTHDIESSIYLNTIPYELRKDGLTRLSENSKNNLIRN